MSKVYWPKFFQRKFILLTAFFVLAQVLKFKGIIGDIPWLLASCIGVFGFVVVRLWLEKKREG